ncbi:MAG: helix-turn-helix domain-containing protein [Solirubrobacteraceae bacterium]
MRETNNESEDEFLSIPEVARRLKLSRATIYRWIDEGRLPALKLGKNIRLRAHDVDRLLEASWTVGGGSGDWSDEPDTTPMY